MVKVALAGEVDCDFGSVTVIVAVPTLERFSAGTFALSCVALTNAVDKGLPFQFAILEGAN